VGAYSTKKAAEFAGDAMKSWRGEKYEARVIECDIDTELPTDVLKCISLDFI